MRLLHFRNDCKQRGSSPVKIPIPNEPEIAQALQGNICRCGTHPRIVAAVLQAAKAMHAKTSRGKTSP